MSTHTITANIAVKFRIPDMPDDEREVANVTLDIDYTFMPGRPAHTPRGEYAPIDPPEPAEVSLVKATLIEGDGLDPTQEQIDEWAQNWLDDAGYDVACTIAAEDRQPDPDDARDRAIERRMMRDEP
jgi:hypothetical protein